MSIKLIPEFKDVKFNSEEKVLEFGAYVKGPAYKHIVEESLVSNLIDKNEQQIKDYIKGVDGVLSAKVILSPFWVRRVPANREKIKFELQYE
jgi:hypothetical protein